MTTKQNHKLQHVPRLNRLLLLQDPELVPLLEAEVSLVDGLVVVQRHGDALAHACEWRKKQNKTLRHMVVKKYASESRKRELIF